MTFEEAIVQAKRKASGDKLCRYVTFLSAGAYSVRYVPVEEAVSVVKPLSRQYTVARVEPNGTVAQFVEAR